MRLAPVRTKRLIRRWTLSRATMKVGSCHNNMPVRPTDDRAQSAHSQQAECQKPTTVDNKLRPWHGPSHSLTPVHTGRLDRTASPGGGRLNLPQTARPKRSRTGPRSLDGEPVPNTCPSQGNRPGTQPRYMPDKISSTPSFEPSPPEAGPQACSTLAPATGSYSPTSRPRL